MNQGVNPIVFIQTQKGPFDPANSDWILLPHFYMWKVKNMKNGL